MRRGGVPLVGGGASVGGSWAPLWDVVVAFEDAGADVYAMTGSVTTLDEGFATFVVGSVPFTKSNSGGCVADLASTGTGDKEDLDTTVAEGVAMDAELGVEDVGVDA